MEYKETALDIDNRFTIVKEHASNIRKLVLLVIASDDDKDIVGYAKNINKHLLDIEDEYYKVFRELATEQIISDSLIDVIGKLQQHPDVELVQERGETEVMEALDELPFVEESKDEDKIKEAQDETVTNILDKIVKVEPIATWQEKARELLKDEPVNRIVNRDVYYIPPESAPVSIDDEPGTAQYIEAIDKYNLNYLLIERKLVRHTTKYGTFVEDTIVIDTEDEEVVMDFVEGRDKRYRYLDSENNLTQYAKFIIDSNKSPYEFKVDVKVKEPSFKEEAKQKLLKDTVYNTGDQRYYLVSGIPSEEYGANSISYIEGFDADTLEYLLIEDKSDFSGNVTSEVLIRTEDEEELRRHVEGKPFTFKYVTPDGKLTEYAKKKIVRHLIKNNAEQQSN
nr:MAG TPA: hypothetical protein [Bacteriophage sp.]